MLKSLSRLFTASGLQSASRAFTTSSVLHRTIEMEKVNTTERLSHLRQLMKSHKVDIYSRKGSVVPEHDC